MNPALPVPPAQRGTTTVADRVIEKIAAAAAAEITHADGLRRRIAGRNMGQRRARANATVDGSIAVLSLDIAVHYPASVRQVTRAVRTHVAEQVTRLCELRVDHIDITVAVLLRPENESRMVQ